MIHTAYIGIGSNLGNRVENCEEALRLLDECRGITVADVSPWYETEAETVDGRPLPDEPRFINGAAGITTALTPEQLLARMLETEEALGRPRERTKGDGRTVDLDLLLFENEIIDAPGLHLPHHALRKRVFVLRPLCDIAPETVEPVSGKTVAKLLDETGAGNKIEE